MKKMIIIILAGLILTACSREPGRYYNKDKRFSVKFPTGWQVKENPGADPDSDVMVANSPDVSATASVREQKFTLGMALSPYAKELSQKLGVVKQLEGGIVKIDGRDAYWMVCDGNGAGPEFTTFYYCLTMEDRIYSVIFITRTDSFGSRRAELEGIAQSFKFE